MALPLRPVPEPPLQLTSFVGRRHELARIDELLRGTRLLTIVGTGATRARAPGGRFERGRRRTAAGPPGGHVAPVVFDGPSRPGALMVKDFSTFARPNIAAVALRWELGAMPWIPSESRLRRRFRRGARPRLRARTLCTSDSGALKRYCARVDLFFTTPCASWQLIGSVVWIGPTRSPPRFVSQALTLLKARPRRWTSCSRQRGRGPFTPVVGLNSASVMFTHLFSTRVWRIRTSRW